MATASLLRLQQLGPPQRGSLPPCKHSFLSPHPTTFFSLSSPSLSSPLLPTLGLAPCPIPPPLGLVSPRGGLVVFVSGRARALARRGLVTATSSLSPEFHKETEKEEEEDEEEEEETLSQSQLLWRAAKLPLYSVALVPLSVGTASAYSQTGVFHSGRFFLLFFSAFLVITWLNMSNDAHDADTGVDKKKKESLVNITGSRKGVLFAAYICLLAGVTGLVIATSQSCQMQVIWLFAASIACGYVYQCPPFRLSYKGLGEPLCFLAFGPLSTTAFYLCQASNRGVANLPIPGSLQAAAVLVGITTTLILFCSHFHQIDGDQKAGKISPLVRLGTERGSKVVKAGIIGLYTLVALFTSTKVLPISCAFFTLLTLPIGKMVFQFVKDNHKIKEKIFYAKYFCVRLNVAFGLALVLGFITAHPVDRLIFMR